MATTRTYLHTLRSWWWIVLLLPVAAAGTAAYLTAGESRVYRAVATAAVAPSSGIESASDVMRGLETLERRTVIATFASVAEANETVRAAAELLEDPGRSASRYRVRASVVPSTNILRVTVEGPEPARTAALANAVVQVLGEEAQEMYRIFELRPLEAAVEPRGAIHPDPARNVTVAAVLGLFAGLLATLALEHLRPGDPRPSDLTPRELRPRDLRPRDLRPARVAHGAPTVERRSVDGGPTGTTGRGHASADGAPAGLGRPEGPEADSTTPVAQPG